MDGDTHVWSLPQFTVTGTLGRVSIHKYKSNGRAKSA